MTWLVQGEQLLWQSLASSSFAFGKTGLGWGQWGPLRHPRALPVTQMYPERLLSYLGPVREDEGKQGPLLLLCTPKPASPQSTRSRQAATSQVRRPLGRCSARARPHMAPHVLESAPERGRVPTSWCHPHRVRED